MKINDLSYNATGARYFYNSQIMIKYIYVQKESNDKKLINKNQYYYHNNIDFQCNISSSHCTLDTLELEINRPYKYYKLSEIDSSFIGKEVFIDFKKNLADTIVYNIKDFDFEVNMFSTKDEFDTGLGDGNAFYLFLENWIFDTKTGYLKDYYLNSKSIIHTNPKANCFITKVKILKLPISNKTEYFEFIFEYYIIFEKSNNKIKYRLEKFPQTYGIDWIKGFVIFDKNKE